ncbi:hypothetical protein JR316_0000242 [Psilocybe cubensis]|uniref:Uncharacterized protein n=2 Tax=Psilocybe cubensis TaxID=181762 RepID=A0A8H7Y9I7_PSICU|nr:hypothetical protein JR316_0000242 [Psilocybe cubensis]KAH9486178.1 hypothetical protein JR316_0000242 [Psilocybe cubensis]
MAYSHILDEIFAERNAKFERYGIHEKREQWNAYNKLLRDSVEGCIDYIKKSPISVKSYQFWKELPDDRKKKLILDVYTWEEDEQAKANGKYKPSILKIWIHNQIKIHLQFASARKNDTTRKGLPLVDYSLADSQKDANHKVDKYIRKNQARTANQCDSSPRKTRDRLVYGGLRDDIVAVAQIHWS